MESLDGLFFGLQVALTWHNFAAAFLGALVGTFVGVMPGIGPIGAIAILLPVTIGLSPETALIMFFGIYSGSLYGGSTTSILLRVPGEATTAITAIDGYAMAQRGRAGAALGVAAVGSFLAGTLGLFGLAFFAPVLADLALKFGPPEYLCFAVVALLALSRLGGASFWKSLLMACVGLAIGTIGMDPISGVSRYTFGSLSLSQGVDVIPVIMGFYGLAELLVVVGSKGGLPRASKVKLRDLFPTIAEWRRAVPAMLRGTAAGFPVGLIPGPATIVAVYVSYAIERMVSKKPEEFGNGAIEGVAGPEASNNAASSGAMVPLLALGVPFSPVPAVLLAALLMHGIRPGPLLMTEHPEIFWGVIGSMYVGNIALLIMNLPLISIWVAILRIPQPILVVIVIILMFVGAYAVNNNAFDLVILVVVGCGGYLLRLMKFDPSPLILGLVLGPIIEKSFRQSLFMGRGDLWIFIERPISLGILLFCVLLLVGTPILSSLLRARRSAIQ